MKLAIVVLFLLVGYLFAQIAQVVQPALRYRHLDQRPLSPLAGGYSGDGAVWAMKKGDFVAVNFHGDSAGVTAAIAYCLPYGYVQLGPGMEGVRIESDTSRVEINRAVR